MPHHQERTASSLAHGPAKADDIERVRRETEGARAARGTHAEHAIDEMETACQTIRDDLSELKRIVGATRS
jgi:hypothetical protein